MQKYKYPRNEHLKSKTKIEELFKTGRKIHHFPITIIYIESEGNFKTNQWGVSVSKKKFKKAVDRNSIKRQLRESFRLTKQILFKEKKSYLIMILFSSNEKVESSVIKNAIIKVIEKIKKHPN